MTEKDAEDILFGIEQDVDFVAASFVRRAKDVLEIRELLENNNGAHIQIIPKIENQEGVDNIDEIIQVSDGLMVARGDLRSRNSSRRSSFSAKETNYKM